MQLHDVQGRVYVPVGEDPELDERALATYAAAMPEAIEIVGVDAPASAPWMSTDALHCRTKGIPAAAGTKLHAASAASLI